MSEPKCISPLLDGFSLGAPMGSHDGVTCYPAIKENSENKYIIKKISIPASQVQLDALLLTGAYKDPADATDYFKELSNGVIQEAEILQKLGKLDGFLPFDDWQVVPMEDGKLGYEVYLVGTYKRSLEKYMRRHGMTHLEAVNLGLDLCQALAICRRAGCLYVDLKPSNIFISKGKEYRIGDLGFVALDSLKYTSHPGKYRSPYSPPEAQDDLKTLTETADTYAVGMILYQIYNNGILPEAPKEPKDPFPSPANADYEIGEIILKALSPDPRDRWNDPMDMGQALVAYMQRNTVNNDPIVPPSVGIIADPPIAQWEPVEEALPEEPALETKPSEGETPDEEAQETLPVGEENSAPEEEPVPSVETPTEEPPAETDPDDEDDEDFSILLGLKEDADAETADDEAKPEEPPVREIPRGKRKGKGLVLAIVLILILALLGAGGFYYYQNIYLQTINGMNVEGSQNQLVVSIDTDTEDTLLTVTCTDTYGNSTQKTPENGQVIFDDLLPNSQYKITLSVNGFHKLVGKTTDMFNTEALTNIVSFSAITGAEDGSAILNFTVDGGEPDEWIVTYSAEGEEELSQTFTGHNVTIRGLSVGKVYTFCLGSEEEMEIQGQTTLEYTASRLVMAQDLTVVSCENGDMTVRWSVPEDAVVEEWTVRCYSNTQDGQTQQTSLTEAVFSGIDTSESYTVEVFASGMTQPARVSITANPITITGLTVDTEDPEQLTISWEYEGTAPEGGWLLMYSLDNSSTQNVVKCSEPSGVIAPRIHGATYKLVIQAADSTSVFNGTQSYNCPNAQIFDEHSLNAEKLTGNLLKTPEKEDWNYKDITAADYASQFTSGDKLSLVLYASVNFYIPEDEINVMYVIRDGEGNVISELISQQTLDWYTMWLNDDYHYCELDVPSAPTQAGNYTLSLYFNGYAVCVLAFSIVE